MILLKEELFIDINKRNYESKSVHQKAKR